MPPFSPLRPKDRVPLDLLLVSPHLGHPFGNVPLGPAYLASSILRRLPNTSLAILDLGDSGRLRHTPADQAALLARYLRHRPTRVLALTVLTPGSEVIAPLVATARRHGVELIVAGGPHASVLPQSLLDSGVDAVVVGEGEEALGTLLEHGGRGLVRGEPEKDLDTLPFPARTLFDFERYIRRWVYLPERGLRGATLITGRGCPFSCTFCQPTLRTLFGPVLRRRSPENVVEELRQLKKDHRIDAVFFHDDTFTLDQAWLQRFCTLATPLELLWGCNSRVDTLDSEAVAMMHSAGLRKVHLGIESIVPAVRNGLYKKGISNRQIRSALACLHERGIATLGFFMLGGPGESEAEQEATIDFACRSTLFEASFSLTTPFPGTVLH
ncbi:MAG: hypothetical protein A2284_06320, partial [Deltaproteobacteria bacterium RIFOXYA12_FULL_61_11]